MTHSGWLSAVAVLQAMLPQIEIPESTKHAYEQALNDLDDDQILAAIRGVVTDVDFNNLKVPTLAEIRAAVPSTRAPQQLTEEQRLYRERYAAAGLLAWTPRDRPSLPAPRTTKQLAAAVGDMPRPLTQDEWQARKNDQLRRLEESERGTRE